MNKTAIFPGSFDPVTLGHYDLVIKAAPLFDELIVAMGTNTSKKYHFTKEQRFEFLQHAFSKFDNVEVKTFEGLTVDFCKEINAKYIVRGLRNSADFRFEKDIANMNKALYREVETIMFVTTPDLSAISSSIVREIIKNNGDVAQFLPPGVRI